MNLSTIISAIAALFKAPTPASQSAPQGAAVDSGAVVTANRRAGLDTLALCEGTAKLPEMGYATLFGNGQFHNNYVDHPRVRFYEKHDEFIRNGKVDYTTAAGRYQITESTFERLMRKPVWLSGAKPARDFTPKTQDALAIELIAECGALAALDAGDIAAVCRRCRGVWASLPDAPYGQPTRNLQFVLDAFAAAGGVSHGNIATA